MLDEEEQEDKQMKERFKERWNRTPSKQLTEQLRAEGAKYMSILNNATKADSIVKAKYNEHRRAMDILCKSEVLLLIFFSFYIAFSEIKLRAFWTFPIQRSSNRSLHLKDLSIPRLLCITHVKDISVWCNLI